MPVYTYITVHPDGTEGEAFDVIRKMSDPPLTHHPETGEPVKRVYKPANIAGTRTNDLLSNSNVEKHGFTKYVKSGKGHYERHAGTQGPKEINVQ